jgi:hypothetical protein
MTGRTAPSDQNGYTVVAADSLDDACKLLDGTRLAEAKRVIQHGSSDWPDTDAR